MADDRWRPRPNVLCRVEPDESEVSPAGVWQVLAHGPESPTSWWLMPVDGDSIHWVTTHSTEVINRCTQVRGNRLRPHRVYRGER